MVGIVDQIVLPAKSLILAKTASSIFVKKTPSTSDELQGL